MHVQTVLLLFRYNENHESNKEKNNPFLGTGLSSPPSNGSNALPSSSAALGSPAPPSSAPLPPPSQTSPTRSSGRSSTRPNRTAFQNGGIQNGANRGAFQIS